MFHPSVTDGLDDGPMKLGVVFSPDKKTKKMKAKNKKKRLAARVTGYENVKGTDKNPKKKTQSNNGFEYTRPGSLNK